MINFVIYEDDNEWTKEYKKITHRFMGKNDDLYKIYTYTSYSDKLLENIKKLNGQNVFILDIEVKGKSGLDLAREIRKFKKTMNDQIIIVTAHQDLVSNAFHQKLLMVDFISKFDDLDSKLLACYREIYEIFNSNKCLSFKQDGEIVRIPYNDILFVEKNTVGDYLVIETLSDEVKFKSNIAKVEKMLSDDARFFKTHRSCIVNTFKITKLNSSLPVIYFGDKYTTCLSRDKRKALEEKCLIGGDADV